MSEEYPTHEEVRWWMKNHSNFPSDFRMVRRFYEEAKKKGEVENENDK